MQKNMMKYDFHNLWTLNYPNTIPLSHKFKFAYNDRWFRIHSLPKSKRYADNETEWKILLSRQNEIITDLFGLKTNIFIVRGEYYINKESEINKQTKNEYFNEYSFIKLDDIDLYKVNSDDYSNGEIFKTSFAKTIWKPKLHNNLLREIAEDNTRAFFINFEKDIIVAPYDGGIDFILKDSSTKDFYKNKYNQYLSDREDGM